MSLPQLETIFCKVCGMERLSSEFGIHSQSKKRKTECNPCLAIKAKKYRELNRDKYNAVRRERWKDPEKRERLLTVRREYKARNRQQINEMSLRSYYRNKNKNVEQRRARQRDYEREKVLKDPQHKIRKNLRTRLYLAIRKQLNGKNFKNNSTTDYLGCSVEFFCEYLTNLFIEGMSWSNYGEWEIDHIRPLSAFDLTIEENRFIACHYSNLQPLWKADNIRKGGKI